MVQTGSENSNTALAILERMFDAEQRFMKTASEDLGLLAGAFHQDILIHEPASLPYAGDWQGHAAIGQLFAKMNEVWSSVDVEAVCATLDGDTLFMGCTLVAIPRNSSQEVRQPFAEILKLKEGLVIEGFPYYFDTAALNMALGYEPLNVMNKT